MPPKTKYTKEQIIEAAYELTRQRGIDAVVAREVGKYLNTSSSPIFTVWNSMEELKEEVFKLSKKKYQEYMADIFDYTPAFKEYGLRCVNFAIDEPNLYRLLFLTKSDQHNPYTRFKQDFENMYQMLVHEIISQFALSEKDAKDLLIQMIIFANGIAAYVITDPKSFSIDYVSRLLSQVCIGIVISNKLRDGSIDYNTAHAMASGYKLDDLPKLKVKK